MALYIAVGAGPCADLITLRGIRALERADLILYDRLVDISILDGVSAEKISVGKTPYEGHIEQESINRAIRETLLQGKTVARLKGGDSLLFSRLAEELAVARSVGAEIEIVPGVTAASSAAAKLNGALTDRQSGHGVVFLTGHTKSSGPGGVPAYEWEFLASGKLTIVIYMGVKYIRHIARELIGHGLSGSTPAVAASHVEQEGEKFFPFTLDGLAQGKCKVDNPSLFIIGRVLETVDIFADSTIQHLGAI